jgi:hypothetical protein
MKPHKTAGKKMSYLMHKDYNNNRTEQSDD